MIDLKKIKDLIKLMVANDLTELDLEGDGERVTLKRELGQANAHYLMPPVSPVPAVAGAIPGGADAAKPDQGVGDDQDGLKTIASPMVGTFYASPSPDAKPFVSVGDQVAGETVVCVIEAMKVFNEIKAEATGSIEKVLVDNGQAVEFDQPLFLVRSN